MENVTDALHMAFGVLAFVVALSVSIFAFGEVRVAAQGIIDSKDRETTYTYIDYSGDNATRTVTREDIIPTLYRAYKENYIVRFEGSDFTDNLYKIRVTEIDPSSGAKITRYKETSNIDLEGQSIGNAQDANTFVNALLDGKISELDKVRFSGFQVYGLSNRSFYDILEGKTFKEKLGVFYQEDRINESTGTAPAGEEVDDVNKTEKRIITYIYQ